MLRRLGGFDFGLEMPPPSTAVSPSDTNPLVFSALPPSSHQPSRANTQMRASSNSSAQELSARGERCKRERLGVIKTQAKEREKVYEQAKALGLSRRALKKRAAGKESAKEAETNAEEEMEEREATIEELEPKRMPRK